MGASSECPAIQNVIQNIAQAVAHVTSEKERAKKEKTNTYENAKKKKL